MIFIQLIKNKMEELIEENKKLKEYIKVLECKIDEEWEYTKNKSIIISCLCGIYIYMALLINNIII
jgi:hypoxanthine-guanine phosphoribosyltransferase